MTYSEAELLRLIRIALQDMTTKYRFTKTEAAHFLAISTRTLDRHVNDGAIPAYLEGKLVMFKRTDLEAYADNAPAWEPKSVRWTNL
ncbi:helix-turn-helix domain-containing protein [Williamsia sp. DF01-3]|uniref:helix-turn-helix domain-containing protein n=1 Tax=Williamsia sp. DF01-3 TaxID=2934157 RepID=UPI001FF1F793|nr:helix-turn-helix domain-containing protein [Williamsia sp. DF01-3]MCK0516985.1 helix-turn-helix domain-containing protein [Williamsia sp. DF01-3]